MKKARYVKEGVCTACGECAVVCPVEVPSDFDCQLANRNTIYRPSPQGVPNTFVIEKTEPAPCKIACPIHQDVPGYMAMVRVGKYGEAISLIRKTNPLPSICGRVCYHPCEEVCRRLYVDESLSIASIKRFAADYAIKSGEGVKPPEIEEQREERVAIIGSGPAGLSAAHKLALLGYRCTIFEALPVAGGMMAVGIPDYRLPRDILQADIDYIKKMGVEVLTNIKIGRDLTISDLQDQGHKAIFIATGAHTGLDLNIPGKNLERVYQGIDFLRRVNLKEKVEIGRRVAVIGGGNTAMDASRAALRLGAEEVKIIYRRSRQEMPASGEEIKETEEEGVEFNYLLAPTAFLGKNGELTGLRLIRMKLGEPDASGRRRPIPMEGTEHEIPIDTVIQAIGQAPELIFIDAKSKFDLTRWNTLVVDGKTLATDIPGIFAGGDVVSGPASVIEAIAAGKKAAASIHRYLLGELEEYRSELEKEEEERREKEEKPEPDWAEAYKERARQGRVEVPELPGEDRVQGFQEVSLGYEEKEAQEEASRCLGCGTCVECMECVKACEAGAIDHQMKDEVRELEVGAIVAATGFGQLEPTALKNYGYRQYSNVLTGLEFERILSATGPTGGHIIRPSDSKAPQKIVFIQCVGSRMSREDGNPYCSVYCCTNSIKCALLAKTHDPNIKEISILYMDIRTYGKEFQELFLRAKEVERVRFLRGRPARVVEDPLTKSLTVMVENAETNRVEPLAADIVILSTAAVPSSGAKELARILGIEVNSYGFFKERDFNRPIEATRPGVYLAGSCSSPRDITDSVAWGTAAAVKSLAHMEGAKVAKKEIEVEPIDPFGEPRIGVFVCHCGVNIAGVVDVEEINQYAQTIPGVVYSTRMLFACSDDSQKEIQAKIKEYQLNRVVVASCTPRTHEPIFRETCALAGLNPYLFEMANIRDQCSWVHSFNPKEATEKAKDLVRMAVARCHLLQPLESRQMPMNPDVLVVGGGIAGIQASLDLARLGLKVTLVEKEERLGGRVRELATFYGEDYSGEELIKRKTEQLDEAGVNILTSTMIKEVNGFVGNFEVSLRSLKQEGKEVTLPVGSIVVAIGSDLYDPTGKLGYGSFPNVLTNMEMEKLLRKDAPKLTLNGKEAKNIVFVQCVGSRSREEGNPDCSRYCCLVAIKQALKLREKGARVVILYRDIIPFGKGGEELYRKARGEGVLFLRYDVEAPPQVIGEGRANTIRWKFSPLNQEIELPVDLLVLSVGMVPREVDAEQIKEQLKIPRSLDGFFMERHSKLGPVETSTAGIFICGCAQSPKDITDSVAQASAAAGKVAVMASKEFVDLEPTTCVVREEVCRGCGTCQEVCQFHAPELVETPEGNYVSRINEALCKGCGTCASLCPTGAIVARHFTDLQIDKMVEAMLTGF